MGGQATSSMRAWLRARFGIWPLYEARNKALGWPRALLALRGERREISRLRRAHQVPTARVTTVIPTYRRPETLLRALHTALAQDVDDHVVIVVDDGAGLPELPDDQRLVAVSLSQNTGRAGQVRNVGVALARSPFLAFLDDDNEWHPHHLSVALEALEGDADLVYTALERVHPDGTSMDVVSQEFDRRLLAEESYVDASSIVVRNSRHVRFSRIHRSSRTLPKEDWELVWRLSRRLRVRHVPELTVRYTVNPDSYFTPWGDDQ
jgi:glycosyltransferase involved in cell wall biosynthesis